MNKCELLLPAGNLEKLRFALLYGADAVYIGGKVYSLRAQASNFSLSDIDEAVKFAHNLNKKVYITVNVIPREKEIDGIKDYLINLEKLNVDGIIVSSPVVLYTAKNYTHLHVSVSTQASSINTDSVNFLYRMGAKRIVLGRELSVKEIQEIKENTDAEVEVFIHGGMCSSYSGRCTLSNYLSNRDANRGGCAHSCRWNYDIYKDEKINKETFQIASKDLDGIPFIKDVIEAKVDSLKVEGRMKSVHYVATIAYTYRRLIDDIYSNKLKDYSFYEKLIESAENRYSSTGFLGGDTLDVGTLYSLVSLEANKSFCGIVLKYDNLTHEALVETRNYFEVGDNISVMSPGEEIKSFVLKEISNKEGNLTSSRHALSIVKIKSDVILKENDILRRNV